MKALVKYYRELRVYNYSLILFFLLPLFASGQYIEDEIKAAYVERITRFVDWPRNLSAKDTSIFVIGVFGDKDFYNTLSATLKTKTIKGRRVEIKELNDLIKIELCDVCYISGVNDAEIKTFLSAANRYGVLVMAAKKGLGEKGVHLNFYLEENKLKFEINRASIDSGKFRVSSMLLKSSRII